LGKALFDLLCEEFGSGPVQRTIIPKRGYVLALFETMSFGITKRPIRVQGKLRNIGPQRV
jgi:hypothetical protein